MTEKDVLQWDDNYGPKDEEDAFLTVLFLQLNQNKKTKPWT